MTKMDQKIELTEELIKEAYAENDRRNLLNRIAYKVKSEALAYLRTRLGLNLRLSYDDKDNLIPRWMVTEPLEPTALGIYQHVIGKCQLTGDLYFKLADASTDYRTGEGSMGLALHYESKSHGRNGLDFPFKLRFFWEARNVADRIIKVKGVKQMLDREEIKVTLTEVQGQY
jgi:hypothetical protein